MKIILVQSVCPLVYLNFWWISLFTVYRYFDILLMSFVYLQIQKKTRCQTWEIQNELTKLVFTWLDWSDWLLTTYYHRGLLAVGASYTRNQPVTLPNAIFGNFSILVITDVYNDVYEHDDEDDNLKAKVISLKTFEFFPRLAQHWIQREGVISDNTNTT